MFLIRKRRYQHLNTIFVNRKALEFNLNSIQSKHPEALVCPVIKSNAYGHGLSLVAPVFDRMHLPFLCVDSLYEAYELMKMNIKTQVFIMGYTNPVNFSVKHLPFEFCVFDKDTVDALGAFQKRANIHIKIDTGMSRYGIQLSDLREFVRYIKTKNLVVTGLWSHFADADNPENDSLIRQQLKRYKEGLAIVRSEGIDPKWRHISASAGAYRVFDPVFTMMRIGLALYGIPSFQKTDTKIQDIALKPVLTFVSTISQIKRINKGDTVGYNATFKARHPMTIGIIPAGYFEGIDRRLSNRGFIEVNGASCPIIGRVSMNITVIDLTHAGEVHAGYECLVYGNRADSEVSVVRQSNRINIIPYDLLVHLSPSVHRQCV